MKKYGILSFFALVMGLFFLGKPLQAEAEEYAWAKGTEGVADWYVLQADGRLGEKLDIYPELTELDSVTILELPDEELIKWLSELTGDLGTFHFLQSVVVGAPGGALKLASVDMSGSDATVTVNGDVENLLYYRGNLTLNGNAHWVHLGSPNLSEAGLGTIVINGDAQSVTWYRKTAANEEPYNYFAGNFTINGTVEEGTIIEYLLDPIQNKYMYKRVGTLGPCTAGTYSIINGVISEAVDVTEEEISWGNYTYWYQCYGFNGTPEWHKQFIDAETNEYAGYEICEQKDIPANSRITIYGTGTPVVIDMDVESFSVYGNQDVDVTLNGNVVPKEVNYVNCVSVPCRGNFNVVINGTVEFFDMKYQYNPNSNVTVKEVKMGTYSAITDRNVYKYFTCNNTKLIENGKWNENVILKTEWGDTGIGVQPPSHDEISDALAGNDLGTEVTVGDKTLVKDAAAEIFEQNDVESVTGTDDFKNILDTLVQEAEGQGKDNVLATPVCALEINLNTFYVDKESGEVSTEAGYGKTEIKELAQGKSLSFTIEVPAAFYKANSLYKVIRNHVGADGNVLVEVLETIQNGSKLTFSSDKFSTFVIVEVEETESTGGGDEPGGGDTPGGGNTPGGEDKPVNPPAPAPGTPAYKPNPAPNKEVEVVPVTYMVVRGDTLYRIASKYHLTLKQILEMNPFIKNPNRIYPGQILVIGQAQKEAGEESEVRVPADAVYDTVQRGDCLYLIARRNHITLSQLAVMNPELMKQRYIFAGQKVRVK